MVNLRRHLDNVRGVYGIPCVVAVNRFPTDTDPEVDRVVDAVAAEGVRAFPATHFADGGAGAHDLAEGVLRSLDEPSPYDFSFTYPDELSLTEKVEAIATRLYGASLVTWDAKARRRLLRVERDGYGALPVCVAKTQYSFSTDPKSLGAPTGHELHVREVRLSAGAGFVVVVCGDMMTMPGLPHDPSASTHRPRRRRHHPGAVLTPPTAAVPVAVCGLLGTLDQHGGDEGTPGRRPPA